MQAEDFARILSCFADSAADVDVKKGEVVLQIRDELVQAKVLRRDGEMIIEENDQRMPAISWLINRIARLPMLADRILSYVPEPEYFVKPSGTLLDRLDRDPSSAEVPCRDALSAMRKILGERTVGTSSVLYLTSDAGEGKTTLISKLAREQAQSYKRKDSDWLILPIPLGGRAFLRFDELVIGALVNKLRFQLLYYDGFIELVRLGVIVPAFDGFEEMFIEGSSGEAISALGNLMSQLRSEGTVLVAARKAYFEYQSFHTQARLFDAMDAESVSFSRMQLERWSRSEFVEYGQKRGLNDVEQIYEHVVNRFQPEHPLLTRAVLVRKLLDIASSVSKVDELMKALGSKPQDYFYQFVKAIIQREANEKWLDKEGREGQLLLDVREHLELLSAIAQEMWTSCVDSLRVDVIDLVTDLFCEQRNKSPVIARQIKERIKYHALLRSSGGGSSSISFDHEDFRQFFVGYALGHLIGKDSREDLRTFLNISTLSSESIDQAVQSLGDSDKKNEVAKKLVAIGNTESSASFVLENLGALLVKLLDGVEVEGAWTAKGLTFPAQALKARNLTGISFDDCYFAPSSLTETVFHNVTFRGCSFERLELVTSSRIRCRMYDCTVGVIVLDPVTEEAIYNPDQIVQQLHRIGIQTEPEVDGEAPQLSEQQQFFVDSEIKLIEKFFRIFLRNTQVNEELIKLKLSHEHTTFFDSVMPTLLKQKIVEEIPYRGSGSQRRYKLNVPMSNIQAALAKCDGSYERFLNILKRASVTD